MVVQNSIALEAQRDERPLAKKQEQLEDVTETEKESVSPPTPDVPTPPQTDAAAAAAAPAPAPQEPPAEKHVKKALLKDNDWELIRVSSVSLDGLNMRLESEWADHPSSAPHTHPRRILHVV